jgi:hypothetical protein
MILVLETQYDELMIMWKIADDNFNVFVNLKYANCYV